MRIGMPYQRMTAPTNHYNGIPRRSRRISKFPIRQGQTIKYLSAIGGSFVSCLGHVHKQSCAEVPPNIYKESNGRTLADKSFIDGQTERQMRKNDPEGQPSAANTTNAIPPFKNSFRPLSQLVKRKLRRNTRPR